MHMNAATSVTSYSTTNWGKNSIEEGKEREEGRGERKEGIGQGEKTINIYIYDIWSRYGFKKSNQLIFY